MRISHDDDGLIPKDMCSLGVVDVDLSLSPDAFGLQAFDNKKPLTRMLPGSTPCELWLMLPDSSLGTDGFHDVLIDNLVSFLAVGSYFAGRCDSFVPTSSSGSGAPP